MKKYWKVERNGRKVGLEGIKIAIELIQQVREIEGVHGVHIMVIEWEDRVPEIGTSMKVHSVARYQTL